VGKGFMKKLVTTIFAVAGLALMFPAAALAGAEHILTAYHAGASFSSTQDGVLTEVFIDAGKDELQTLPNGGKVPGSRFNITIQQCPSDVGICGAKFGAAPTMLAIGHLEPVDLFVAKNLRNARLQATIELTCEVGSCPAEVAVDLVWQAKSPPVSMTGTTRGPDEEGCIVNDAVLHRDGVAHGTVTGVTPDGLTNFVPNPDFGATLEWVRSHRIPLTPGACTEEPPVDDV
jgi:hypothetical protein